MLPKKLLEAVNKVLADSSLPQVTYEFDLEGLTCWIDEYLIKAAIQRAHLIKYGENRNLSMDDGVAVGMLVTWAHYEAHVDQHKHGQCNKTSLARFTDHAKDCKNCTNTLHDHIKAVFKVIQMMLRGIDEKIVQEILGTTRN